MPTYTVRSANLSLDDDQRQRIARAITEVHSGSTGAPGYFAQIFFDDAPRAAHFIGGRPNPVPHVYVHGLVRAGRTAEQKRRLMEGIRDRVCDIARVGAEDAWVYVQEIAAEQMIEFGRILPEPGREAEWRQGFSAEKIEDLRRAGVAV